MSMTRRDFLKVAGASVALLGIGAKTAPSFVSAPQNHVPISPRASKATLVDLSKCVGCKQCQLACQKKNNLPQDTRTTILSASALSVVEMRNVLVNEKPKNQPVKRQCMSCVNPSCVAACTVGALQKTPEGPVVYDENRCIGCRYCMYACPFGVPTFEWSKQLSLIRKCNGCADLQAKGQAPACVQACPANALSYGDRTELLTIANERVYSAKSAYVKHVYGEREIGGTAVMYISAIPFEQLGFPVLPEEAPAEINATIMHSTPTVAAGMAMALSGVYWLVKKRNEMELAPIVANDENGGH
ncbi:MAG: 4Fe-4S dicluster domain-containing protein [Chloroflexi bacterium]|nr:4Fe-4S dicluster domain-containing protein [Chloroflexota bacterium]